MRKELEGAQKWINIVEKTVMDTDERYDKNKQNTIEINNSKELENVGNRKQNMETHHIHNWSLWKRKNITDKIFKYTIQENIPKLKSTWV